MWLRRLILTYLLQNINTRSVFEKYGPLDSRKSLQRFGSNVTLDLFSPPLTCSRIENYLDSGTLASITVHYHDFTEDIAEIHGIVGAAAPIRDLLGYDDTSYDRIMTYNWVLYVPDLNSPIETAYMRKALSAIKNMIYIAIDYDSLVMYKASYRESYETAVAYLNKIAVVIHEFLVELYMNGVPVTFIKYIGHGLGAQILGSVGFMFKSRTGRHLKMLTALDPAGPCFSRFPYIEQARKGAAAYVEIYHCNAGGLGTTSLKGDVDFIANIRVQPFQPGCKIVEFPNYYNIAEAARCSHDKCVHFYAATINGNRSLSALKCTRPASSKNNYFKDFKKSDCNFDEPNITAGFWNPGNAEGVYYFSTTCDVICSHTLPLMI